MAAKTKASEWIDILMDGVGSNFWLETSDGIEREGKISGFGMKEIEVNGSVVEWPVEIEVNGDSMDKIPLNRVKSIRVG